jgi:hypothetical protein
MPYETHWEDKGIRWVFSGIVTDDDLLRCNLELYDDERFESIRYEIADFRAGESFTVTAKTLRRVARMDRDQAVRNPSVKVAVIATAAVQKGLAQVYALSGGDTLWVTEVFDTEEDARAWLSDRVERT